MLDWKFLAVVLLWIAVRFTEAERPYMLEVEKIEIVRDPKFLLQFSQLRVSKFNSTANVINCNLTFLEDMPEDTVLFATAYQLMASNKYSMIPVALPKINMCEMLATDKDFYRTLLKYGNFVDKCPLKKGAYYVKNYIPDNDNLPEELPGDRWRLDLKMASKKRVIAKVSFFVYINRNI